MSNEKSPQYILHGGLFLNPRLSELKEGIEVLIEGDRVREVSDTPIRSGVAARIDLRGKNADAWIDRCSCAHVHERSSAQPAA